MAINCSLSMRDSSSALYQEKRDIKRSMAPVRLLASWPYFITQSEPLQSSHRHKADFTHWRGNSST
jgi:hypothetical protein